MKKNILLSIFTLASFLFANAQKELWGVNTGEEYSIGYYGNITKYDINGENPVIMHEFDSINGYRPKGRLFLASNGKLYGTTLNGGNTSPLGSNTTAGVLFEYDLILNKYRVVKYFDYNPIELANLNSFATNPQIGVLEPIIGQLYGATLNRVYKYDTTTENTTFSNALPDNLLNITSEFIKASDGNLYSTAGYAICPTFPSSSLWNGCIIKFNTTTNNLSIAHVLSCDTGLEGNYPNGIIEINPGLLLGTTRSGGVHVQQFGQPINPAGILFEYNINTNLFTKKLDFNGLTIGGTPNSLINGNNGKIYGLCEEGGIPLGNTNTDPTYFRGTLYEYTPTTNTIEVKQYFGTTLGNYVRYPTSLMRTSNGYFMGTIPNGGLFGYDAVTNTIITPYSAGAPNNSFNNCNLIEICRKPSYHEITTTPFTPCVGDNFIYDIQNTNAASYVWSHDNVVLPAQTTAVLNLPSIALADSGTYTCTMTNECGTTVTMPLYVNASCLSVADIVATKNNLTLYPNPTKNILNIKLPENKNFEILKINIVNMLGQTVFSDTKNFTKVDTSKLPIGTYEVILKTNNGDWNGRFVKE